MESKFLDQNVDVMFLANKGIVNGYLVCRNYNKILMEATSRNNAKIWQAK